ncbi:hypothetical protein TNCV_3470031 [Trichonephila clavipes]|nr:hypothetical protein TNCV_3470031 [Trichonephila clavipes]
MQLPMNSFHGYGALKVDIHLGHYLWQCIPRFRAIKLSNTCLSRSFNFALCCASKKTPYPVLYRLTLPMTQWSLNGLDMDAPVKQALTTMYFFTSGWLDIMIIC